MLVALICLGVVGNDISLLRGDDTKKADSKAAVKEALPPPPPLTSLSPIVEEFDVSNDGDFLLVPVTISGKTYSFAVDTGCSNTIIDTSVKLGDPVDEQVIKSADGRFSEKLGIYHAPQIVVGKITWQGTFVHGKELSGLRQTTGLNFHGVLGLDFLRGYALRIDFDRGKLAILRSPVNPKGKELPILWMDANYRQTGATMAYVLADIANWGSEPFLINTGHSTVSSLNYKLFRHLARKGFMEHLEQTRESGFFSRNISAGYLQSLTLGDISHKEIYTTESPWVQSILGLDFWRRYNLTFDFPCAKLYLQKSKWFAGDDIDLRSGAGILFDTANGIIQVDQVFENSPAAQAGLKVGDVLTRIAGKKPTEYSNRQLYKKLCGAGSKVSIVFSREGIEKEMTLALHPWSANDSKPAFLEEKTDEKSLAFLLFRRGIASHFANKNVDRVLEDCNTALSHDASCVPALTLRACIFVAKNDFQRAIRDYNKAIRLDRSSAVLFSMRGNVWSSLGEFPKALHDHNRAIQLAPRDPICYFNRAYVWIHQQKLDNAKADFDEAVRLGPNWEAPLLGRADVNLRSGKLDDAILDFHEASKLSPNLAITYFGKARCYAAQGQAEKAIDNLVQALELGHSFAEVMQDPSLNSLRSEPAFEAVAKKFGK